MLLFASLHAEFPAIAVGIVEPDSHVGRPGTLRAESRLGSAVIAELRRRGHQVEVWPAWVAEAGAVCAVQRLEGGLLLGGADPRREAYAIGW